MWALSPLYHQVILQYKPVRSRTVQMRKISGQPVFVNVVCSHALLLIVPIFSCKSDSRCISQPFGTQLCMVGWRSKMYEIVMFMFSMTSQVIIDLFNGKYFSRPLYILMYFWRSYYIFSFNSKRYNKNYWKFIQLRL